MYFEVFGGRLQSEIDFPELRRAGPGRVDWTLRRTGHVEPLTRSTLLGEEVLAGDVAARLERGDDRFRLHFGDTGTFDISLDGSEIGWTPSPGADESLARSDFLGRVLSVALHAAGDLCLHASAVALTGSALVFVGAKGHGKSTLAMALVAANRVRSAGAKLLSDDTVRIAAGEPPMAAPGVPSARLWDDAATRLGVERLGRRETQGDKLVLHDVAGAASSDERLPLAALYLLDPMRPLEGRPPVARRPLGATEATLVLMQHAKTALLLGKGEAGLALVRAGAVARSAPIYALEITRDLARLDEVAAQVLAWHQAPASHA